jgi:hypothetical protein
MSPLDPLPEHELTRMIGDELEQGEAEDPPPTSGDGDGRPADPWLSQMLRDFPMPKRGEADGEGSRLGKLRRLDVLEMVNTLPPEVPWIAQPLLVRGVLTLLYGREGEGKSLLAYALAIAVASGEPVAGFAPAAGKVVYVDAENGSGEIHRRIRALGLPNGAARNLAVYTTEDLDLRRDLDELEAFIAAERPALVVLDSFRSLWRGKENDSEETGPTLDRLRNLGRRLDAGILLVHHSGKTGEEYRGSTGIGASCELIFRLAREPEDEDPQRRFLACRKSRPAPEPGRRWLRLSTELGLTFVDETEAPNGEAEPPARGRPPRVFEELSPRLLAVLEEHGPLTLAEGCQKLGRSPKDRTVRRVLEKLDGERVHKLPDGRWAMVSESGRPRGSDASDTRASAEDEERWKDLAGGAP